MSGPFRTTNSETTRGFPGVADVGLNDTYTSHFVQSDNNFGRGNSLPSNDPGSIWSSPTPITTETHLIPSSSRRVSTHAPASSVAYPNTPSQNGNNVLVSNVDPSLSYPGSIERGGQTSYQHHENRSTYLDLVAQRNTNTFNSASLRGATTNGPHMMPHTPRGKPVKAFSETMISPAGGGSYAMSSGQTHYPATALFQSTSTLGNARLDNLV